jgi:S-DNA-T family DNA segregation ATPase FtsK/SpoIIIE
VHRVVEHLKKLGGPQYLEGLLEAGVPGDGEEGTLIESADAESDPMYDQAVNVVLKTPATVDLARAASPAHRLQPRRAADRADGAAGLVSPMQSNGNRDVLVPAGKGEPA